MRESVCPPQRMRYSLESRCRIVRLILAGESPQAAAVACGASRATGYRLWRRYQEGGWSALIDRPPVPVRQPRRLSAAAEVEHAITATADQRKAEALVKTLLREWAYRFVYPTSAHRARALPGYIRWYNKHRPHGSIGRRPPLSRVSQVCGTHS